jgi:hypothetical protein
MPLIPSKLSKNILMINIYLVQIHK